MATLYRRNDSPYWWCYGYDAAGERWLASTKQTSRRAAEKTARAIERERVADVVAPYAAVSVSEALDVLYAHKMRKKCRPGTMAKFAQKRAQLERVLGADTDVHGLTLASFERYTDQRRHDLVHRVELGTDADGKRTRTSVDRPVSDQTIAMEVETILAALRRLKKHGLYGGEPGELMPDELKEATYTPRERWLTVDEYRALHGTFAEGKRRYLAAYVYTGMRLSELYQCERVGGSLIVTQTKGNAKVGEVRTREVPIAAELLPVLDAHPLPWPRYPNEHMHDDLKRACNRVGIAPVSANDLRRTFCSWLCNAGVPELAVIRLMGHSSSAMVRRVYAQLAPSTLEDAIARLPRVEVT